MEIDRLCALVEPAMKEADKEQGNPRFAELQRELDSLTSKPSGAGVDLPLWLRRLEQEVQRVRSLQSGDTFLSEGFVQVPQIQLSWEEVQRQIQDWLPAAEGP